MSVKQSAWRTRDPQPLNRTTWDQLVADEIPLITIKGFASSGECAGLVERANRCGFEPYEGVMPPIDRIGITVFEYDKTDRGAYFVDAVHAKRQQLELFAGTFDPLQRFMERLAHETGQPVEIARDPQQGLYHAGLVRRIEDGTLLHIDFAPAEQPTYGVAQVTAQLSWNVYLQLDPQSVGRTRLYNRQWVPEDDKFKIPRSYGYRHEVLGSIQPLSFRPTLGDVFIFNTRNFHEVSPSIGRRTTFTSQIGVMDDKIILWS